MEEQRRSREEALARLATVLEEPTHGGAAADERAKVLTTLYQEYGKRFVADNNRIWTTAASMIPLSLGAFALLASIERPTIAQVVVLPVDERRAKLGLIVRPGLVRRMRYALWVIVTVGAVATILWWPGGLLIDL